MESRHSPFPDLDGEVFAKFVEPGLQAGERGEVRGLNVGEVRTGAVTLDKTQSGHDLRHDKEDAESAGN